MGLTPAAAGRQRVAIETVLTTATDRNYWFVSASQQRNKVFRVQSRFRKCFVVEMYVGVQGILTCKARGTVREETMKQCGSKTKALVVSEEQKPL